QLGQPAINLIPAARLGIDPANATVGVRPEDISPDGGSTKATVKVVENMGPTRVLLVEWLDQEVRMATDKGLTVAVGDKLFPRINLDRAVVWREESIQRTG